MTHTITVRDVGHVTEIVFSNPPNNHANVALLREIGETLLKLDDTPECRAIVLASEGKAFCAGADLRERKTMTQDEARAFVDALRDTFTEIAELPVPTVAAVNG